MEKKWKKTPVTGCKKEEKKKIGENHNQNAAAWMAEGLVNVEPKIFQAQKKTGEKLYGVKDRAGIGTMTGENPEVLCIFM